MTRTIGANMLTDLSATNGERCYLIELQFLGGTVFLTTASRDVLWSGDTYQALGGNLVLDGIGDTLDDRGQGAPISLSGVDLTVMALVLGQASIGRLAIVTYAAFNQTTGAIITNPIEMFRGFMNEEWTIEEQRPTEGAGTCTISTRLLSRVSSLSKVRGIRTNVNSHQSFSFATTDTFFQNVAQIAGNQVYWGQNAPSGSVAGRFSALGKGGHMVTGGKGVGSTIGGAFR